MLRKRLKKIIPARLIGMYRGFRDFFLNLLPVVRRVNKETGILSLKLFLDVSWSVLRYGIRLDEYRLYRFYEKNHFGKSQFLSYYRKQTIAFKFNPAEHQSLFDNKNKFNRHFSEFIGRQWLYTPDASDHQIETFLSEHSQIIIKPQNLYCGIGVRKVLCSEISDVKTFCESARKDRLLLEEIVKQHPDLNAINPFSVNTVRINTVIKDGTPHILCAGLRMGRGQSVTDNLAGGGIIAQIDTDTGVLFTPAVGKDLQSYIKHPTSGVLLPGFLIPHWEAAREMALHVAKLSPQNRWVGWDVAITEGGPLLIEGNTTACAVVMQLATQKGIYPILRSYL